VPNQAADRSGDRAVDMEGGGGGAV